MNNRVPGIAYIRNSMYNRPNTKGVGAIKPEHKNDVITGVEAATPSIPITERKVTDQSLLLETSDRGVSSYKFLPKNIIMVIIVAIIVLFLFKDNHY